MAGSSAGRCQRIADVYTADGFAAGGDLYTLPALDVQTALVIGVVFYGDLTTYGISFTDAGGAVHQYMLYISGRNGSLVMQKQVW